MKLINNINRRTRVSYNGINTNWKYGQDNLPQGMQIALFYLYYYTMIQMLTKQKMEIGINIKLKKSNMMKLMRTIIIIEKLSILTLISTTSQMIVVWIR